MSEETDNRIIEEMADNIIDAMRKGGNPQAAMDDLRKRSAM